MPEGDTVFRTARRLDEALAGHEVTRFELRVPQTSTADLTGATIQGCASRGKHLLLRIGDRTLHSHLRMDGAWHLYRPGEKWRHPAFTVRAIVGTGARDAVGVDIAAIDLVPTTD
ncbi:MAG: DNA-formamidopyrimidine glycosylase family protein, partial [Microbacterium sp.]